MYTSYVIPWSGIRFRFVFAPFRNKSKSITTDKYDQRRKPLKQHNHITLVLEFRLIDNPEAVRTGNVQGLFR